MSALGKIFKVLGSAKLALVLIFLVILFSVFSVVIPQQGTTEPSDMQLWQSQHPTITKIAEPIGLFTVFTSWLFISTLIALAINTLTCTLLKFSQDGGVAAFKRPDGLQKIGFVLLHVSIITIIAGGAVSAATRTDGNVILIKGQNFTGSDKDFLTFVKGPLAGEYKQDFVVTVTDIQTEFDGHRLMDVTSKLVFSQNDGRHVKNDIKVNRPFTYQGIAFTQDKTGYAVLLDVTDKITQKLFTALVVLKTYDGDGSRMYQNYFRRAFMKNEIMVTLYPGHSVTEGEVTKTSEQPDNPILFLEKINHDGSLDLNGYLPLEDKLSLGEYEFEFLGLRPWSSFRLNRDPGYATVCVGLWLGLIALILRYATDILSWFKEK